MEKINYEKLGFKCGLEIHQQLSGLKLFCKCPAINVDDEPDVKIRRKLRASAGEMGKTDVAAKFEMNKGKEFIYTGNSEDVCLIELDEQPPYPVNENLLDIALQVSMLLNAKIVDEIQIMRKTVVDGSNTAGFQRTALVAMDGFIETSMGKVEIPTICLEEEAAQKLEDSNEFVKYKLDRLGIGLIEIGTDPSIKNAEHAKEVATQIGMILRSVGGIRRGLGTIRQDVNISIKGHPRVEVKGFQDLKSIPKTIENEIKRQLKESKNSKSHVRKAETDFSTTFLRPMPGADRMYIETDVMSIQITDERIKKLRKNLPKLLSDKIKEFEKKYKLGSELVKKVIDVDYFEDFIEKFVNIEAKVIANTLVNLPKEIKKRYKLDPSILLKEDFEEILQFFYEGKITKEAIIDLLIKKIKKEKISIEEFEAVSENNLEKEVKNLIKEKKGLSIGAYMGILMGKYRGKVDGKKIVEILKKYLK